ncbi:unnamed protein product [Penicillium roqueforti FM164]|uniref:Genomic scaffold, ProqFM164S02 n=1 Tax=Penicillium roqueforti (strain FM164) TaxID=1365484 RepID=W6Q7M2_PENRF|nr:unnamed protein product [Penicillium roqueforti FM164]
MMRAGIDSASILLLLLAVLVVILFFANIPTAKTIVRNDHREY